MGIQKEYKKELKNTNKTSRDKDEDEANCLGNKLLFTDDKTLSANLAFVEDVPLKQRETTSVFH